MSLAKFRLFSTVVASLAPADGPDGGVPLANIV